VPLKSEASEGCRAGARQREGGRVQGFSVHFRSRNFQVLATCPGLH
jgi:hypothetical protein